MFRYSNRAVTLFHFKHYCGIKTKYKNKKSDRAYENRACGHMIFAYFLNLSELITFFIPTFYGNENFSTWYKFIWHYGAAYRIKIFCSSAEV